MSSPSGKPAKNSWTQEEVDALKKGVVRWGIGNWAKILSDDEVGPTLKRRTNVNIKVTEKHRLFWSPCPCHPMIRTVDSNFSAAGEAIRVGHTTTCLDVARGRMVPCDLNHD